MFLQNILNTKGTRVRQFFSLDSNKITREFIFCIHALLSAQRTAYCTQCTLFIIYMYIHQVYCKLFEYNINIICFTRTGKFAYLIYIIIFVITIANSLRHVNSVSRTSYSVTYTYSSDFHNNVTRGGNARERIQNEKRSVVVSSGLLYFLDE